MTVRELIEKLSEFDPDALVMACDSRDFPITDVRQRLYYPDQNEVELS